MRAIDVRHQGRGEGHLLLGGRRRPDRPRPRHQRARRCSRRSTATTPRALLLTHIHFDHAGATGALVRRWPDLPVYVHERGAPHMVDPAKLVASAGRLYGGEEGLTRAVGRDGPGAGGQPARAHRRRDATSRARSASSTRPATPPTTSATSTSRRGCAFVGDMARRPHPAARVHGRADAAAGHRRRGLGALDRARSAPGSRRRSA